jgi:hypothetical protein
MGSRRQPRHTLDAVHRFIDPDHADLTLKMRTGTDPGHVFDSLLERGDIVIHPATSHDMQPSHTSPPQRPVTSSSPTPATE